MSLKIYTRSGCSACAEMELRLEKAGLEYETVDADSDDGAVELMTILSDNGRDLDTALPVVAELRDSGEYLDCLTLWCYGDSWPDGWAW